MSNSVVSIILLQIAGYYVASEDNACETVLYDIAVNGVCLTIDNCPLVRSNIINQINNHTLCGYIYSTPIVCCPIELYRLLEYYQIENNSNVILPIVVHPPRSWLIASDKEQTPPMMKTNLRYDLECKIESSTRIGVMKFASECPELNINDTVAYHFNKLCDYEICADLVCCPVQHKHRLKKVCPKVDHPIDTLELRLLQNQECTINELFIKGKYQRRCDFAERNPILLPLLQNVCNDSACNDWYCCPIEDDGKFECTEYLIPPSIAIFVGPKCIDSRSGHNGTCKTFRDCRNPSTLDKCGTRCCDDYFCCPDDELVNPSIAARACRSYTKYLHKVVIQVSLDSDKNKTSCSIIRDTESPIKGGVRTKPADFPHMAALGYESNGKEILWNCGGSLISDRYVLTAAHCISIRAGLVKKVRLGVVGLLNEPWAGDCPEEYNVIRHFPYPEYKSQLIYNDIGLIELDGRVIFNFHIRPICLPISSDFPQNFLSTSFGAFVPLANERSRYLLVINQTLFSHKECDELYRLYVNRKINQWVLNETQICAGSRDSKQSTCKGDSGGPLLHQHSLYEGTFDIYGIVSHGAACGFANTPGIYTKVYPYVKWIEGIVWNTY